jgi:hypothetical protein
VVVGKQPLNLDGGISAMCEQERKRVMHRRWEAVSASTNAGLK